MSCTYIHSSNGYYEDCGYDQLHAWVTTLTINSILQIGHLQINPKKK